MEKIIIMLMSSWVQNIGKISTIMINFREMNIIEVGDVLIPLVIAGIIIVVCGIALLVINTRKK